MRIVHMPSISVLPAIFEFDVIYQAYIYTHEIRQAGLFGTSPLEGVAESWSG